MSELTYLQKRLALKNGQIQSTDSPRAAKSEDQPKSDPTSEKKSDPRKKAPTPSKGLPGKRGSKIKKASKKRSKELRQYKPVRNAFLKDHPTCEVKLPGCQGTATQIHHQSGREGKKLLDITDFLSCCDHCHRKITEQSREAIQAGHSKSRLGKPQK